MPFEPFYDRDGITIYNADCRAILPFLDPFDLLLTDPPYGINADNRKKILSRKNAADARDYGESQWDKSPPPSWLLGMAQAAAKTSIMWGGNYYGLPPSSCWLVWDKDNTGDFADCELAWTNMNKAVRKFRWRWNGMLQEHGGANKETRFHPTQKPLALMKWCLSLVPEAKTIVDPFMGSGTTLLAARHCGLRAVGMEISREHCESAVKRLSQRVLDFSGVEAAV